jgi:hypothetical protein
MPPSARPSSHLPQQVPPRNYASQGHPPQVPMNGYPLQDNYRPHAPPAPQYTQPNNHSIYGHSLPQQRSSSTKDTYTHGAPSTQELQQRLRQQRQHYEGQQQHHTGIKSSSRTRQEPLDTISSYASSTTSSDFSDYVHDNYVQPTNRASLNSRASERVSERVSFTHTDVSQDCDDDVAVFDMKMMPPLRRNEYDFTWEGGSLGLVLVEDSALRMPVVKRVSSQASAAAALVAEGDALVLINLNSTRQFKMPALMGMLKDIQKPICLRFRRLDAESHHDVAMDEQSKWRHQKPLQEDEYEFHWEGGSLGMTMGIASSSKLPYVKRLTGRGTSPHLSLVHSGDELIMINQYECASIGFEKAMEVIKAVPKPAVLRFRTNMTMRQLQTDVGEAERGRPIHHDDSSQYQPLDPSLPQLDENSMYSVQWSDGPFGLTVKECLVREGSVPVVTRKTGRSTCAGLRRVAVGDLLVEIGSMKATDLGFENATKILRSIAKPVTLKFQAVAE